MPQIVYKVHLKRSDDVPSKICLSFLSFITFISIPTITLHLHLLVHMDGRKKTNTIVRNDLTLSSFRNAYWNHKILYTNIFTKTHRSTPSLPPSPHLRCCGISMVVSKPEWTLHVICKYQYYSDTLWTDHTTSTIRPPRYTIIFSAKNTWAHVIHSACTLYQIILILLSDLKCSFILELFNNLCILVV